MIESPSPITIFGSYKPEHSHSMDGYAALTMRVLRDRGYNVSGITAPTVLGRFQRGRGAGPVVTTLRELDRFAIAPMKWRFAHFNLLHITDHANAFYLHLLRVRHSILTVHDIVPVLMANGKLDGQAISTKRGFLVRFSTSAFKKADAVVCVSEATKRDVLDNVDIDSKKLEVIPNAIFQPMARSSADEQIAAREQLRIPCFAKVILHVGSNIYRKNRQTVFEVFKSVAERRSDVYLIFVGPKLTDVDVGGADDRITDQIRVLTNVSSEELGHLYSYSDVLLFPSIYEGFGYPILEAQCCGLPVVCSNGGALAEVAGESAILCDALDVARLAEAIEEVFENDVLRERLIAAGTVNTSRFSLSEWGDRYLEIYSRLI